MNLSWKQTPLMLIAKIKKLGPIFLTVVIAPTLISVVYYGLIASDVYVSESRFVVRSPDKAASTGLGVLLKSTGFSNGGDEIFAAQDYLKSRDALGALNQNGAFASAYASRTISIVDRFNPLGIDESFENLYQYYRDKVIIEHDAVSSISTLRVRAFTPQDAKRFNRQLLEMAEATVNRLNERGRQDLIKYASADVENAKRLASGAALALSRYRNRKGVVDPEKQAAVQLQMISKLQDEMIAAKTELLQLRRLAPQNPQIDLLKTRVTGLNNEIAEQLGKVAGDRQSLSSTTAQYQRLVLESQFADKQLTGAMASLQEAQNEARRKQAYVERIVQPSLPDKSLEPRRLRGVLATFVLGLLVWGIITILVAGVREHQS